MSEQTEGTYTQIPNVFFDTCDLPETAQILYLRLYREIHYKGCKFTGSIRKLSKLVRLSKSTVDRMIKKLKEAHLITAEYSQSDEEMKEIMTITLCKEELWTLNRYHHHIQTVPNWDTTMPEIPDNCPKLGQDVPEMGQNVFNLGHGVPDVSTKEGTTRNNNINNSLTREDSANQDNQEEDNPPPSQNKSFNEDKKVEQFRDIFISLGREYFAYNKFTVPRLQPNSEAYARVLEIIGDGEVSLQSMRVAFLKLWNHKDKDGTYWWRDKSKLTLKAFTNNYDDQDTSLEEMDPYVRACMISAGRLKESNTTISRSTRRASTPGSQYIVDVLSEAAEEQLAKFDEQNFFTEGPLAGCPAYNADPWL